jgi:hypothetical protein
VAEIAVFIGMARLSRRFSLRAILLASFAAAVLRALDDPAIDLEARATQRRRFGPQAIREMMVSLSVRAALR